MMSFYVETEVLSADARLIYPHGTIDNASFEILEHALRQAYSDGITKVLINLDQVPRISSVGIGVLISCQTHVEAKTGGKMVLLSPQEDVIRIFEVMDYMEVFAIAYTREEGENALLST